MAYIQYLGHATFMLQFEDTIVYIDPYFSTENRLVPAYLRDAHGIKKCDIIFITHEHFDHFEPDTVKEIVERTYASVVAPRNVLGKLQIPDKFKVDVKVGDKFQLKGVGVEVIKAIHPQSVYPVGYVIEKDGMRVYHAGDTYEFREMMDVVCDWALLPIGGTYTMDIIDAEKAAKEIGCRYVVPMHYGSFDRIKADPNEFARALEGSKVKPIVLKYGEKIELRK